MEGGAGPGGWSRGLEAAGRRVSASIYKYQIIATIYRQNMGSISNNFHLMSIDRKKYLNIVKNISNYLLLISFFRQKILKNIKLY